MTFTHTLIIAEAGVNHNGDMRIARKLIDVAFEAGADIVKFQTFSADKLVTATANKAEYQKSNTKKDESQYEMLRKLELTREMHEELIGYCARKEIGFLSTAFDIESVDMLMELGVQTYKVPSGDMTNLPYIRHIGKCKKNVILSTGMATLSEVKETLDALESSGTPRENIIVLHCTTDYPTKMQDVNLNAMVTMRNELGVTIGYSDHTQGIEVPVAAVALGAKVIEKHFTLDKNMEGPDHKASLDPQELKKMVTAIRNIELAMGDGCKKPSSGEANNISIARKSLVAAKDITAGDIFTKENLTAKRPGIGISPMLWDSVIGRVAGRNYKVDEVIDKTEAC